MSSSLKKKLEKKRKELNSGGKGGSVLYVGEGTTRVRILPNMQDELAAEVAHVYFNSDIKGVYLNTTLGLPCPIDETYQELKKSKDDEDQDIAKKLSPKKAYLIPVIVYEDDKGKKIDEEKSGKLMKISGGVYQNIIDLYLDEDDWGDMTNPKEGYDIKIIRTGKGQNDTEYTVAPCKNTPIKDKKWHKPFDLNKAVKAIIDPYDVAKDKLEKFLGIDLDDDDDKKSKKKSKKKDKSKSDFKSKKKVSKKPSKEEKSSSKKKSKKK